MQKNKGFALIVVMGVLAIFSSLATGLVHRSFSGRIATQNYLMATVAKLNAQAGVERAVALLTDIPHFPEFSPGSQAHAWLFKNGAETFLGAGKKLENANIHAVANEQCVPSFPVRNIDSSLKTLGGHYTSGEVFFTHFDYALKVIDTSSQLHLNAPKFRLIHMLTTLFEEIFLPTLPQNAASWSAMATQILQHRESLTAQEFTHKTQLTDDTLLTVAEYDKIRDFVAVHSWVNPHTWEVPDDTFYDATKPNYVQVAQRDVSGFVAQPRAAVNVNTASRAVLVAVLAELQGFKRDFDTLGADPFQRQRTIKVVVNLSRVLAQQVADAIISHRQTSAFKVWATDDVALEPHSFYKFLDDLSIAGLTQDHKELIKANVNPNSLVNRWLPNSERYFPIDKTDVVAPDINDATRGATTELCFSPSGIFEIQCIGRVFHPTENFVLSDYNLHTIQRLYHPTQHTQQRDFFDGSTQSDVTLLPETIYHCNNSQLLDGESNNVVQNGSTIDGYIQMKNTVEFSTARNFTLFFEQQNFADLWEAKVGGSDVAPTTQHKVPTHDSFSGNALKARSLFKGEFRTPEGSLCKNYGSTSDESPTDHGQMHAFANSDLNINAKVGTIAMWVKFENINAGADEPICHMTHIVDGGARGIETSVFRYNVGSSNELHIVRWIWEDPVNLLTPVILDNADIPTDLWTRIVIPDIDSNRLSKKWYRLVIAWEDYTQVHAVFTHDGTNSDATALFHYSESLANTIPNNGPLTVHLDRIASSGFDKTNNPFGNSSFIAFGGYDFTPKQTASLFNQSDVSFTNEVAISRFSNMVIGKVEGYSVCHINSSGGDFYETPYVDITVANPGGTFEQQMQLSCGCNGACQASIVVKNGEFTMWSPGSASQVEFDSQIISLADANIAIPTTAKCGDTFTYRVLLTSDDGQTTPIFDDITIFSHLVYPKYLHYSTQ